MRGFYTAALLIGLSCHQVSGQCPLTQGAVELNGANQNYTLCKDCASGFGGCVGCPAAGFPCPSQDALCDVCARPWYEKYKFCTAAFNSAYNEYGPWVMSLRRDMFKYCGTSSSSGSSLSLSSGSQSSLLSDSSPSIPSSGSFRATIMNGPSNSKYMADWQIAVVVSLVVCGCCLVVACVGGGFYVYKKGILGKKANRYEPEDDQEYYDDGTPVEEGDYPADPASVPYADPATVGAE